MRILVTMISLLALLALAAPVQAEEHEPEEYGSLWLGPRVGPAIGFSGPRAGYLLGVVLSYQTPRYFYYNIELGFLHLLPRTITVGATTRAETDGSQTVLAPEHDVKVTGLYGLPMTLEVGLRYAIGRVSLRIGVGFGAMLTIQTAESYDTQLSEIIMSFCFRPGIGVDLALHDGAGQLRFDLAYLWQDANFAITGHNRDVDSLFLTVGYSWRLLE